MQQEREQSKLPPQEKVDGRAASGNIVGCMEASRKSDQRGYMSEKLGEEGEGAGSRSEEEAVGEEARSRGESKQEAEAGSR